MDADLPWLLVLQAKLCLLGLVLDGCCTLNGAQGSSVGERVWANRARFLSLAMD